MFERFPCRENRRFALRLGRGDWTWEAQTGASFSQLPTPLLSDKRTARGPTGLTPSPIRPLPRWRFPGQWQMRWGIKTQTAPPPLQLSECERGWRWWIKKFGISYSSALAKCRFPRPPPPRGPSPLKPEKPECLWQCERWAERGQAPGGQRRPTSVGLLMGLFSPLVQSPTVLTWKVVMEGGQQLLPVLVTTSPFMFLDPTFFSKQGLFLTS